MPGLADPGAGTATPVPGLAKLNKHDFAQADSVSCASPGSCTAGGFYKDAAGRLQAFVANETAKVRRR